MLLVTAWMLALGWNGGESHFWVSIATGGNGGCVTIVSGHIVDRETLMHRVRGRASVDIIVNADVPYGCVLDAFQAVKNTGVARVGLIPPPPRVRLVVPPGACRVEIDGRTVDLAGYRREARRWARAKSEIRIEPDPAASYACVDQVLSVLRRASGVKLGFVGNDVIQDPQQ